MDGRSERRRVRSMAIVAALCFALGVLASQLPGVLRGAAPGGGESLPAASSSPMGGDGSPGALAPQASGLQAKPPTILFDPESISLLPDASLHIDLPDDPWAETAPGTPAQAPGPLPASSVSVRPHAMPLRTEPPRSAPVRQP